MIVECVFTASPGLSQTDQTLGLCGAVQLHHVHHTLRREPLPWQHVPSTGRIPCVFMPSPINASLIKIYLCPVPEGPSKKALKVACGKELQPQ